MELILSLREDLESLQRKINANADAKLGFPSTPEHNLTPTDPLAGHLRLSPYEKIPE